MANGSIEFEAQFARLTRKLHLLEGAAQRKIARKGAREALRPTLTAARANAPVRSGRLRRSVKIRTLKRNRGGRIGARVTTGDKTGDYGGKTYYGAFVEYGHKVGRRSRGVRAAESLDRRGELTVRSARNLRRRQKALSRAYGARRSDARATVAGQRFLLRAAKDTKQQAQTIFSRYVAAEIKREMQTA